MSVILRLLIAALSPWLSSSRIVFFCFCDIWDKLHSARGQVARPRRVWGFELSPLSSGATHEICAEPMRKYWGTTSPRNVVSANTLVLVAHLVTFSESQWYQFHVHVVGLIIYKNSLTVIKFQILWWSRILVCNTDVASTMTPNGFACMDNAYTADFTMTNTCTVTTAIH